MPTAQTAAYQTVVGTLSPDMYFPAIRHMKAMPQINSATGAVLLSADALGVPSNDPFSATPGFALGNATGVVARL